MIHDPAQIRPPAPRSPGVVRTLPFAGDDAALVAGLRDRHPAAAAALWDRQAAHVRRVLVRILGADPDLGDLVHEVFLRALRSAADLRNPAALRAFMTTIAVFTARRALRRRMALRWLRFRAPEDLPEVEAPTATAEVSAALRGTYQALGRLPADERIAFALRFIDGMELTEVAQACGVSLATIKRRLARAEVRFRTAAAEIPAVREWLAAGGST